MKLLIVDDEEEIRYGIKNKINWQSYGVSVCGDAANSSEALQLLGSTVPDVMLVDIVMPGMSGLDLIEIVSTKFPLIKCIIISGHDDFEYARKALVLGACDYLLKPCKADEIVTAVQRAGRLVGIERERAEFVTQLQEQKTSSATSAKAKLLEQLLTGEVAGSAETLEKLIHAGFTLQPSELAVVTIKADQEAPPVSTLEQPGNALVPLGVQQIVSESFSASNNAEILTISEAIVAIVDFINFEAIMPSLETVRSRLFDILDITVTIGVGGIASSLSEIHRSYEESLRAVDARFFLGDNRVILFKDIAELQNLTDNTVVYLFEEEKNLLSTLIRAEEFEDVKKVTQRYFDKLDSLFLSRNQYINQCMALFYAVSRHYENKSLDLREILNVDRLYFEYFTDEPNTAAIQERFIGLLDIMFQNSSNKKSVNKAVESVVKYIGSNYSKDLSLGLVARDVAYMSPAYLSFLFKKVMGVNFIDYLNKVRVDKACELVQDLHLKMYEIAAMVGFSDERYFSYVFKKHMGKTPSQFRSE